MVAGRTEWTNVVVGIWSASLLAASGCGLLEDPQDSSQGDSESRPLPVVEASDISSEEPVEQVVIDRVISDGSGWVVVRRGTCPEQMDSEEASFGPIIGHASVEDSSYDKSAEGASPNENKETAVSLDQEVEPQTFLCAVLHEEEPTDGDFEYKDPEKGFTFAGQNGKDKPVLRNNALVTAEFQVADPSSETD